MMEPKSLKYTNLNEITKDIRLDIKLKQMDEMSKSMIKTKQDEELLNEGYLLGHSRVVEINEEKLNNRFFRSGYERGLRTKTLEDYQERISVVEEMVNNNIDFELAPEDIVNDVNLRTHYFLYSNRIKLEERKRGK